MSDTGSPYPYAYDSEKADEIWALLKSKAYEEKLKPPSVEVCHALFGNSPFLTSIAERFPEDAANILGAAPAPSFDTLICALVSARPEYETRQEFVAFLRECKSKLSLIVAYADVTSQWSLHQVSKALSDFADAALSIALGRLLHENMVREELCWPDGKPSPVSPRLAKNSGYFLLGMGKLGAHELNYSSDIDLIALYDPAAIKYSGKKTLAHCWIKITQELVQIIEQRTMHGYVFRTDLRLRPDPGATPVAITVDAAENYYHSMAVNWERAAMIKARVVAGDQVAGTHYLENLSPWVWRRNMDFAALNDIAAIKNQINRHYDQARTIGPAFNVKLGHGGIREIEFFAQVNQLLHAGRHPSLRLRGTIEALEELEKLDIIEPAHKDRLVEAYTYLRTLEHRIQMIDDAQNHELPADPDQMTRLATFMSHASAEAMLRDLKTHTDNVSGIYDGLLPDYAENDGIGYSENALEKTLADLGYENATTAVSLVEAWRRGRHLALRTARAKALLEQCLPKLLEAFAQTDSPGSALLRFDKFVSQLPAGVQIFSLLQSNPSLFTLLARVMGLAPALADILAKKPELWDMVLEPSFYAPLENEVALSGDLLERLRSARDFQDVLDFVRKFVAEQKFRVGVHLLEALAGVKESGASLTRIADVALKALVPHVSREFERRHGSFPDGGIAILAMGKYGGHELTHTSDLDIVFLYNVANMEEMSDGSKPLSPSQYFSRLGQNIITAITALTPEGRLFEVDTRLRPSGSQGPLVVTLKTFQDYYTQSAWTWEHMALTRARVILSPESMLAPLQHAVQNVLTQKRDQSALCAAVAAMRQKLDAQFASDNVWNIKFTRGGLVDLEFLCQYLMLKDGNRHPELFEPRLSKAIEKLQRFGFLSSEEEETLETGHLLQQKIQSLLRLCIGPPPDTSGAIPVGLQHILFKSCNTDDLENLEDKLERSQRAIYKLYQKFITLPDDKIKP